MDHDNKLESELDETRRLYRAACRELALASPPSDKANAAIITEALRQERLRAIDDALLELARERNRLSLLHGATMFRPLSELAPHNVETLRDVAARLVALRTQVPHPEHLQRALEVASRYGIESPLTQPPPDPATRFFDAQVDFAVAENTIDELVHEATGHDNWHWCADYYDRSVDVFLTGPEGDLVPRFRSTGFHVVRIHFHGRESVCHAECRVEWLRPLEDPCLP